MLRRPAGLVLVLVWLAVVLVVSGVTWTVIDTAGREVLSSEQPSPLPALGVTASADGGVTNRDRPRPSADHTQQNPRGSDPVSTPGSGPEPSQDSSPPTGGLVASESTTNPPPGKPSSTSGSRSDQPPAQREVRAWQGAAGTLTASCVGDRISLESASPSDGWRLEIGNRGPERIEAEFKSAGEDEREAHVRAECSGGAPRFAVEADD